MSVLSTMYPTAYVIPGNIPELLYAGELCEPSEANGFQKIAMLDYQRRRNFWQGMYIYHRTCICTSLWVTWHKLSTCSFPLKGNSRDRPGLPGLPDTYSHVNQCTWILIQRPVKHRPPLGELVYKKTAIGSHLWLEYSTRFYLRPHPFASCYCVIECRIFDFFEIAAPLPSIHIVITPFTYICP